MKCRKAEKQLALFAGGDLPESKVAGLTAHLDHCSSCAAELEQMKKSRALLRKLATKDKPDPLPEDFSRQILLNILKDKTLKQSLFPEISKNLRWRPVLALGGTALILLMAFFLTRDLLESRRGLFALRGKTVGKVTVLHPGEVAWSVKFAFIKNLIGPSRLNELEFPEQPGIYAILHKPDPVNRPKIFAVNFIGENSELSSLRKNMISIGKGELLISRVGSGDSLYIVLYPMPESTVQERREIINKLVAKYEPFFTSNGGI